MYSIPCWMLGRKFLRALTVAGLAGGILMSAPLHARSSAAWVSAASFGGSGSDNGQAVKVDPDGNRYVTGDFSATAQFPVRATADSDHEEHAASSNERKTLTSAGGMDVFLAKYDPSGKLSWLVQAGGSEDDQGFDIAFDAARNVYLTGMFTDSATFQGTDGATKTVTGVGQTIFLAKYRPSGVLEWVQTGTTEYAGSNNGYGVAVEPAAGSVYITGVTQGDTTFSSSDGTMHTVPGVDTWHMVIAKYDRAGNFRWGQTNEASPNTVAHKIAVDAHDNVYATGWMEGQTTFHSADGSDLTLIGFSQPVQSYPDYPGDAFIVKYDARGNVKWANHIGGYKAIGTDIAVSRDGQVSMTGLVGNIADSPEQAATIVTSQPGGKNVNLGGGILTAPFNSDVVVATYNDAGILLSARRYGGAMNDGGSGIAYDDHGNLFVAGIFQSEIEIDRRTLTGDDQYSLFVAKFARGERERGAAARTDTAEPRECGPDRLEWAHAADGPGIEGFENDPRIGLTTRGDVLVTGGYEPSALFGAFKLSSAGQDDGFVAVLRPGNPD
jgi:hypothetical protein